jgi:hypothetical protein
LFAAGPDFNVGGAEADGALRHCWLGDDIAAGDVIIFHSLLVHRAGPNLSDRLRLSVDFRYQARHQPICPVCLLLASNGLSWERVYQGWSSDTLKYYWRRWKLCYASLDPSYVADFDAAALARAERGDPAATTALERIVSRSADGAHRARALELLARLSGANTSA